MQASAIKPLDLGSGRVCGSFDPRSAAWLSIGMPHPTHGFVELSALPPFDEADRGNPVATRRHRRAMTLVDHAFLSVQLDGALPELSPDARDPTCPRWTAAGLVVRAMTEPGAAALRQEWSVSLPANAFPTMRIRLRGTLDRPALAEITDVNPPEPTGSTTAFGLSGQSVTISTADLGATAIVTVRGAPIEWAIGNGEAAGVVVWAPSLPTLVLTIDVSMGVPVRPTGSTGSTGEAADHEPDAIVRRALAYIRGCTALTVGPNERTILTDHRVLPLSWTRDAYWQALALLAADGPGDRERVADHLRWLWRHCERPDGRWVRSHHADGRRKDLAFQADQQLYPIVELADYWRLTGELPAGVNWDRELPRAWEAAEHEISAETGLIGSEENAADDPSTAPFIAASQILLWYAAERVAELGEAQALRIDASRVRLRATATRAAFNSRFVHGAAPWPYAVNAEGGQVSYHDANDLPIALAPLWGFCTEDDPGWSQTMAFAFGSANPAWFEGARAGLGSVHTPGPWTLGDVQAWIRARIIGDRRSMADCLSRLRSVAFDDGMLPEAYSADPLDDRRIRHWFAWPGAALAALTLLDRNERLSERLAIRRLASIDP